LDKQRELLSSGQRVAKLILAKEDVLTVSRALELALLRSMDAASLEFHSNASVSDVPRNRSSFRHKTEK